MELTFPIVKFKLRTINLIVLIIMIMNFILLFLKVGDIIKVSNEKYRTIFSIILILSILAYWILPLIYKNYVEIGELTFSDKMIKTKINQDSVEHPISMLKQITFSFGNAATDGGKSVRLGIDNYIVIRDLKNNEIKFKLFIDNSNKLNWIDKKLDHYKNNDIAIQKIKRGKIAFRLTIY